MRALLRPATQHHHRRLLNGHCAHFGARAGSEDLIPQTWDELDVLMFQIHERVGTLAFLCGDFFAAAGLPSEVVAKDLTLYRNATMRDVRRTFDARAIASSWMRPT